MEDSQNYWSEEAVALLRGINNFSPSSQLKCKRFYIEQKPIGFIRLDFWEQLKSFTKLFTEEGDTVHLAQDLNTFELRSEEMAKALAEVRSKGTLRTLQGWRNECYDVKRQFHEEPVLKMERSATCLFGVKRYGVNIHGYCHHPDKGLCMWVGKRAESKDRWPGKLDLIAAGGLTSGLGVTECARKEAEEEASLPEDLLTPEHLTPVGTASFMYEDSCGVYRDTEFCYDLPLPAHFTPRVNDGEVESFQLLTMPQLKPLIVSDVFKPTSGALIVDFMMRHGILTPENEQRYVVINELLHNMVE